MSTSLKVAGTRCTCGTEHQHFKHVCKASGQSKWVFGCPCCDDLCLACDHTAPRIDQSAHLCTVDELIKVLTLIRRRFGNIGVMICFDADAADDKGHTVAIMEYLPVNQVALDEDGPTNVLAILCVAQGNHPFGNGYGTISGVLTKGLPTC